MPHIENSPSRRHVINYSSFVTPSCLQLDYKILKGRDVSNTSSYFALYLGQNGEMLCYPAD